MTMTKIKEQSLKQKVFAILMLLSLFLTIAKPTIIHADESGAGTGNISDMQVQVTNDGELKITGGSGMTTEGTSGTAWTNFIAKYRSFIVGISGVGAVTMILFFIMHFLKLGAAGDNPQQRQAALQGLIWSGVAAAALGSVTIIVGFFYSALR